MEFTKDLQYRKVKTSDINDILDIYESYKNTDQEKFVGSANKNDMLDYIKIIDSSQGHHDFFVVVKNNKVISFFLCIVKNNIVLIHGLMVHKKYTGKGVGTAVLIFVKNYAKEHKCDTINLIVDKENKIARKVYEKQGFKYSDSFAFYEMTLSVENYRHNEHIKIIHDKRRRTRIDVIAIAGDKVLASYIKSSQMYDLPGGGLDKNETYGQAAIRESMEEAGWICSYPTITQVKSPTLFVGVDDRWYHEQGWDEELQVPVICTAIAYQPDSRYCKEGDGRVFSLISVVELIAGYQRELDRDDIRSRRRLQDRIRIEILQRIIDKQSSKPTFAKW